MFIFNQYQYSTDLKYTIPLMGWLHLCLSFHGHRFYELSRPIPLLPILPLADKTSSNVHAPQNPTPGSGRIPTKFDFDMKNEYKF